MNSGNAAFVALVAGSLACLVGCEAEGESRDPAYPEAIGYTPPSVAPASEALPAGAAVGPGAGLGPGDDGEAAYADADPSALTDFRETLEPYGTWTDDATYGSVWIPSPSVVGPDFTPYVSAGHWDYDSDYVWASDYDWGWAPFHYGRWAYADGPGWEWIPGRQYAGAWVAWRVGADNWGYVGWAALPPTWGWRGGSAVGLGFVPRAPYAFVSNADLFAPSVGNRIVSGPQVGAIAAHTTPFVPSSSAGASGRVVAHPTVGGPTPDSIHIAPSAVARASVSDAHGIAQARAYARPSTAMALGARAPASYTARAGGSYAPSESHFGGRLGGGFAGNAASARPMPAYGARPYFGAPSQASSQSRAYSAPRGVSSPSGYGGHSGGAFRGSSAPSGYRGGGGGGGGGGGRGGEGGGGGGHGGHR